MIVSRQKAGVEARKGRPEVAHIGGRHGDALAVPGRIEDVQVGGLKPPTALLSKVVGLLVVSNGLIERDVREVRFLRRRLYLFGQCYLFLLGCAVG